MIELVIKVSDEQQTLKVKHVLYDSPIVNMEDITLRDLVERACSDFKGKVEDVFITIKFSR